MCRWIGYGFWPVCPEQGIYSNFKRVCPELVLDRVWLQDCRQVFGNPKSETLVSNASRQLSFHFRFTAVNAKFWDYSPSLLGSVLFSLF